MHRANARTGEQRGSLLWVIPIDGDAVALLHSKVFEDIREFLHLGVQFSEGDLADFAGFTFPKDRNLAALSPRAWRSTQL